MGFLSLFLAAQVHAGCANLANDGSCDGGKPLFELTAVLVAFMTDALKGDSKAYLSHFESGAKHFFNGNEESEWSSPKFIENLFSKVNYTTYHPVAPVSSADKNAILTVIDWSVSVKETGDQLHIGIWSVKYTFSDQLKVARVDIVCDSEPLLRLAAVLQPPTADLKALTENFLALYNKGDKASADCFSIDLRHTRNGKVVDPGMLNNPFVVEVYHNAVKNNMQLLDFGKAASYLATANFFHEAKYAPKQGTPTEVSYYESWFLTFNAEGKISEIRSVVDEQAINSLEAALGLTRQQQLQAQAANFQGNMK